MMMPYVQMLSNILMIINMNALLVLVVVILQLEMRSSV